MSATGEGDGDQAPASLLFTPFKLAIDPVEARCQRYERFLLILRGALKLREVAPKFFRLLGKLIDRTLKVLIPGDDVELRAPDDVYAILNPMLGEKRGNLDNRDAALLRSFLRWGVGLGGLARHGRQAPP